MKKQTAALLLSLSMVAGCLAGCAPQNAAVNESPAATPAEGVDLTILCEADEDMINNYSLLAVNPDAPFTDADGNPVSDVYINTEGRRRPYQLDAL